MSDPYSALSQLAELRPGWDSYGARSITSAAILGARSLLRLLSPTLLEKVQVVPYNDGGVQLEAHAGGHDWEIRVGPEGLVVSLSGETAE